MATKITLTDTQKEFLKSNYGKMKNTELRNALGLSQNVFYKQLKLLGLSKQTHKNWTKDEIDYLRLYYNDLTNEQLVTYFNRSLEAIQCKAREIGLDRGRGWSDAELNTLKAYFSIASQSDLLSLLPNRTWSSIKQMAMKLGLSRQVDCKGWTEDELSYLYSNYENTLKDEIKLHLNYRSWESIIQKANKLGLYRTEDIQAKDKGYYFNKDFFKTWSNNMAWVVGWLITDGCVTRSNAIKFNLHIKDKDVLHKLGSMLMDGCVIKEDKNSNCAYISISNKEFISDLNKLGIGVNKTWTVKVPNCPKEFESHLIRGIIEGDGTIRFDKWSNTLSLYLCGNEFVVNYVSNVLNRRFGCTSKLNYRDGKGGRLYYIGYYGFTAVEIITWLYKDTDSSNRLDRKFNIFKKFILEYGAKRYNLDLG